MAPRVLAGETPAVATARIHWHSGAGIGSLVGDRVIIGTLLEVATKRRRAASGVSIASGSTVSDEARAGATMIRGEFTVEEPGNEPLDADEAELNEFVKAREEQRVAEEREARMADAGLSGTASQTPESADAEAGRTEQVGQALARIAFQSELLGASSSSSSSSALCPTATCTITADVCGLWKDGFYAGMKPMTRHDGSQHNITTEQSTVVSRARSEG